MNKLYIFFLFLILSNCSIKPVVKHHGVPFLIKKEKNLLINKSNINDIKKLLGNPSTISKFDNDIWIYIERKETQSGLKNMGKMKLLINDILVLEINKFGILSKKTTYDKNDINEIKISNDKTASTFGKNKFVYDFMSSMRQKANDPLGKRAKKREKIRKR